MSLSRLEYDYSIKLNLLEEILRRFSDLRRIASTQEERLLLEGEAISLFEQLDKLDITIPFVDVGELPNSQDFSKTYSTLEMLLNMSLIKLRKLIEIFLKNYELNERQIFSLLSKTRRLKQKQSFLKLLSNRDTKFSINESFFNLENLESNFVNSESCNVHSGSGVLTLPVRNRSVVPIKKVKIGGKSNGIPGNSTKSNDVNYRIENVINGDPTDWLEYERFDSGPISLELILELDRLEVVNYLRIDLVNFDVNLPVIIEDIVFSNNKQSISIHKMFPGVEKSTWEVSKLAAEGWSIPFLPIRAKTVSIKLVQREALQTSTGRNRWVLGVKNVELSKLRYLSEGGINSKINELPKELYNVESFIESYPINNEFFSTLIDISLDNGSTWTNLKGINELDNPGNTFIWRVISKRHDDILEQNTDLFVNDNESLIAKSILRSANHYQSPYNIILPEKPFNNEAFPMQVKVATCGHKDRKIRLGTGTGTKTSFKLPVELNDSDAINSLHVYVNNIEYVYQEDSAALSAGEWSLSENLKEIEFSDDLSVGSQVEYVFDPEIMQFEQVGDGYYADIKYLFDPDKETIRIESLPNEFKTGTCILPKDQKVIQLPFKNIADDSFRLESKNGNTYNEVANRSLVLSTVDSYYMDYINGILWLNSPVADDVVRVSCQHMKSIILKDKDYEVIFSKAMPAGIKIKSDSLNVISHTDTVGSGPSKRIDSITGVYSIKNTALSDETYTKVLSYKSIIKGSIVVESNLMNLTSHPEEIEFIDGISEFYGLIHIEDEKTTAIVASDDIVSFMLSANSLWYQELGVHFSDNTQFSNLVGSLGAVTSLGDYFISEEGEVSVFIGTGNTLVSDIGLSYYYKNPDYDPSNKYSVDYVNGILYSGSLLKDGTTIKYKTANCVISYSICKALQKFEYKKGKNEIELKTEELDPINRSIKVCWQTKTAHEENDNLTEYFTNIIPNIGFRFN